MIFGTRMRVAGVAGLLWLGTSLGAVAQETATTEETEAPAAEDTEATPVPGQDLAMGEDAAVAPGQPYIKETVDDWDLRCIETPEGEERCQMYQLLNDAEGTPVSEFSLFKLPPGGQAVAGATVVVPLETALQQQLTITVDSGSARRYPFAFCNPIGCYARIGLTEADVNAFKRGNVASVAIAPFVSQGEKVVVQMSLKGFTAAFNKASVIAQ